MAEAEALGTGAIPAELSMILTARFQTVREDGAALSLEKRSIQGIHSFLTQIASTVDLIPGLERVNLFRVDPDGMVHLLHSLFPFWVVLYLTSQRLFTCRGELPAEGLPPVVDISHESFAARCSVRPILRLDHVTHLGGIYQTDWQVIPCHRLGKTVGLDYFELAFQGLTLVPPDCTSWLLEMEEDVPLNVLSVSKGFFSVLTGREPPFEEVLNLLKFSDTADRGGGVMWHLHPRSSPSPQ